jgi:2-methylcitrate dehydratase
MQRIKVSENKEFTRQFPGRLMTEIEVVTRSGQKLTASAQYPKGHAKNPMNDDDVNSKFAGLCGDALAPARRDALLKALWDVDRAADIGKVLELTVLKA